MLIEKIPALYGKALLEAAADAEILEDVAAEVSFVGGLLGEDADLRLFVESPSIESAQKREVFEKTFPNSNSIACHCTANYRDATFS